MPDLTITLTAAEYARLVDRAEADEMSIKDAAHWLIVGQDVLDAAASGQEKP